MAAKPEIGGGLNLIPPVNPRTKPGQGRYRQYTKGLNLDGDVSASEPKDSTWVVTIPPGDAGGSPWCRAIAHALAAMPATLAWPKPIADPAAKVSKEDVYHRYCMWCAVVGKPSLKARNLAIRLGSRGWKEHPNHEGGRKWEGYRLKPTQGENTYKAWQDHELQQIRTSQRTQRTH